MRFAVKAAAFGALLLAAAAAPGSAVSPTDCRACHSKDAPTAKDPALSPCPRAGRPGDAAMAEAPVTLRLGKGEGRYGPVEFAHKTHAEMAALAGGCAACHHHSRSRRVEGCSECHAENRLREDPGTPDLQAARHRLCIDCHREWGGTAADCASCHEAKPRKRGAGAGWLSHRFHLGLECGRCHRRPGEYEGKSLECASCHAGWPKGFKHASTGLALDEVHESLECAMCHTGKGYSRPQCSNCHENRSYPSQAPGRLSPPPGRR